MPLNSSGNSVSEFKCKARNTYLQCNNVNKFYLAYFYYYYYYIKYNYISCWLFKKHTSLVQSGSFWPKDVFRVETKFPLEDRQQIKTYHLIIIIVYGSILFTYQKQSIERKNCQIYGQCQCQLLSILYKGNSWGKKQSPEVLIL